MNLFDLPLTKVVCWMFCNMIPSSRNAGHDEPFAYDIPTNTFITISGVTGANTPVSPATAGAWSPPTMELVGTKIICMGNLAQIDTPYLTEGSSGLTFAVDRFKGWPHGGHITLARGERSRLADFASEVL